MASTTSCRSSPATRIDVFNRFLEPSGQVVEYVRGVSGFKTSYDLNVNDDTPLHIIAILHHYNVTRDDEWLAKVYPLVVRIADYMLTQRDDNGLVFCKAGGVDMFGISSWRNIIPYYTLDGAVTEINAECFYALEAAAICAAVVGDADGWARFAARRPRCARRCGRSCSTPTSAASCSTTISSGNYQDNFTADEVFPVLFDVADPDERRTILERLREPDFTTPVGLRTISTADSWYFPSHGFGLLGGVWPDLTLWFAFALARNGLTARSRALARGDRRDDGSRRRRATRCRANSPSGSTAARSPIAGCTSRPGPAPSICGRSPRRSADSTAIARRGTHLDLAAAARRLPLGGRRARPLGRPALHLRDRPRADDDLRQHARRLGWRALAPDVRRPGRLGRGHHLAGRSRGDRVRGRRRRRADLPLQLERQARATWRSSSGADLPPAPVEQGGLRTVTVGSHRVVDAHPEKIG